MMDIYAHINQTLGAWMTTNGFVFRAEYITHDTAGTAPSRYVLAKTVADDDDQFFDNVPNYRAHDVRLAVCVPDSESASLPGYVDGIETAMIAAGYRPQGDKRFDQDATGSIAYCTKRFIYREVKPWGSQ